jgi:predicted metal-dependent hydrolase
MLCDGRQRHDVHEIAGEYAKRFGLVPRSVRVADMAHGWGSCGPQGNLLINWNLIFAPKKVLEYVVAHELAHLRVRTHGPEFWTYLGTLMPQSASARAWLEQHETELQPRLFDGGN